MRFELGSGKLNVPPHWKKNKKAGLQTIKSSGSMTQSSLGADRAIFSPRPGVPKHIVDQLIEERARHLQDNPVLWIAIRTFIYPLLHYRAALGMADQIAGMDGEPIFDWLLEEIGPRLEVSGLEFVPDQGRCVIVANHPTGIVDGLALYGGLKPKRSDLCFLANRDAIRVAPKLESMVVPVEWVLEKRSIAKTREMWRLTQAAFRDEKAVIVFPSGRVAQRRGGRLLDRPWHATTINLARRNQADIVPLHIEASNSLIYYAFSRISMELRDMTLFNELLNKRGKLFRLKFGPMIPQGAVSGDAETEIIRLRNYIENKLPRGQTFD